MRLFRGSLFVWILLTSSVGLGVESVKPELMMKLPPHWRAAQHTNFRDHGETMFMKVGETPSTYTEMIVEEYLPKSTMKITAPKLAEERLKAYRLGKCKTEVISQTKDRKRSTIRYQCPMQVESGVLLVVDGENDVVYAIRYQLPRIKLSPEDAERITRYVNDNMKICDRADPPKCVR
ncbi:MAG: hypothetical protein V1495_08785 [Pseudomonadota bacterium]